MKFLFYIYFNKTVLNIAVEEGNFEIVKFLLSVPEIDVNVKSILIFFFIKFLKNKFLWH